MRATRRLAETVRPGAPTANHIIGNPHVDQSKSGIMDPHLDHGCSVMAITQSSEE